jgi:hypothetical protein
MASHDRSYASPTIIPQNASEIILKCSGFVSVAPLRRTRSHDRRHWFVGVVRFLARQRRLEFRYLRLKLGRSVTPKAGSGFRVLRGKEYLFTCHALYLGTDPNGTTFRLRAV